MWPAELAVGGREREACLGWLIHGKGEWLRERVSSFFAKGREAVIAWSKKIQEPMGLSDFVSRPKGGGGPFLVSKGGGCLRDHFLGLGFFFLFGGSPNFSEIFLLSPGKNYLPLSKIFSLFFHYSMLFIREVWLGQNHISPSTLYFFC